MNNILCQLNKLVDHMKYVTLSFWFTLSLILQLAVMIVPKQRIRHIINKDELINTESTLNQIKRQMFMSSVTSYSSR